MTERNKVRVDVFDGMELPSTLLELKKVVDEALAEVPEELRDSVQLVDMSDGWHIFSAHYYRPETDEEAAAREVGDEQNLKRKMARDFSEFQRLKGIFEPGAPLPSVETVAEIVLGHPLPPRRRQPAEGNV